MSFPRDCFLFRFHFFIAFFLISLSCVAISFYAGKDYNFDLLNYHFYLGYSVFNERHSVDFFAAGWHSYLSPYAYFPFYWLVSLGLADYVVAGFLSFLHGFNVFLVYCLAFYFLSEFKSGFRVFYSTCAAVICVLNPIFIQELGTSFVDILISPLLLLSWLLLIHSDRKLFICTSAFLFALSVQLKITHSFLLFFSLSILLFSGGGKFLVARCALYSGLVGLFFFLLYLPLGYVLYYKFGNPFFPLFNSFFKSEFFSSDSLTHYRFIFSLGDSVLFPLRVLMPLRNVYTETVSVDARYLIYFVACFWAIFYSIWSKSWFVSRAFCSSLVAVFVCYVVWLYISGNGRYFLAVSCFISVSVACFFARLCNRRIGFYGILFFILIQSYFAFSVSDLRWNKVDWSGKWFDIEVPIKLREERSLYISNTVPSYSFLLPYLAQGSSLVNVTGAYTVDPRRAEGLAVLSLISDYGSHIRSLTRLYGVNERGEIFVPNADNLSSSFVPFGLVVDPADCQFIHMNFTPVDEIIYKGITSLDGNFGKYLSRKNTGSVFISCKLVQAPLDVVNRYWEEREKVDYIFRGVEQTCPEWLKPADPATEWNGVSWYRYYPNYDMKLSLNKTGRMTLVDDFRRDFSYSFLFSDFKCPSMVK